MLETSQASAPFDTNHPFEPQRDEYERRVLLAGGPQSCREVGRVHEWRRVNEAPAVEMLEAMQPDVILVFGTGIIRPAVFRAAGIACLNLHGGNPETYRGLDSHLWAIYHGDFENLITTLHVVDDRIDTGDIVSQSHLEIPRGLELYQLRTVNTQACVELSLRALDTVNQGEAIPVRKQASLGRYYSHMPACLKQDAVRKFSQYTSCLATV